VLLGVPQVRMGLHERKHYVIVLILEFFQISVDSLGNSRSFQEFITLLLGPSKQRHEELKHP